MAYTLVNPYISIAELVEELDGKIPDPGSEQEDKYKRAIFRASRWVDEWTREDFYQHDHTISPIEFDQFSKGVYGNRIFLPHKPVISIASIEQDDVEFDSEDEYSVDPDGVIYKIDGTWQPVRPDRTIKVYGLFGYAQSASTAVPTGLPGKITIATRLVAAVYSGEARKELTGLDGNVQEIAMVDIPKQVFQILGKQMPILT